MRKFTSVMFIFAFMFIFNSCMFGGGGMFFVTDEKKAAVKMEQVIKTIKNQDKEGLKKLFSKKALDEANDIDGNIDHLFNFIQGKIDSWEKPSGPTVFDSIDSGKKKKEINSYYYVDTDTQQYFFLLRDCPIDTFDPDNVGLYLLLVVRTEDEEKIWNGANKIIYDGDVKLSHAGIYIPIE